MENFGVRISSGAEVPVSEYGGGARCGHYREVAPEVLGARVSLKGRGVIIFARN